jgi:tetratricopeptide (TPR) repeat protein
METRGRAAPFSRRAASKNALLFVLIIMPSPESEDKARPAPGEPAVAKAHTDEPVEPVWPPAEARPDESPTAEAVASDAILTKPAEPAAAKLEELGSTKSEEPTATKSEEATATKSAEPAAEPSQEMGLSESTLHWLVDGEQPVEPIANDPATQPHYDPRAPVAGRKRTVALIGGAAVLAFVVALVLHGQAASNRAAVEPPEAADPAAVLTQRAETALSAGRAAEAMDLARLAIGADARFSDAYIVVGKIQRESGRLPESRDAFRKYLELAPLGTHAQEARDALTTLPP